MIPMHALPPQENHKLSESLDYKKLVDMLNNVPIQIEYNNKTYSSTAGEYLRFLHELSIDSVVGQDNYRSLQTGINANITGRMDTVIWMGDTAIMGIEVYAQGLSYRIAKSPLKHMLEGNKVIYNPSSKEFEIPAGAKISTNTKSPAYLVILALADYLSDEKTRIARNGKGAKEEKTCYVLVDTYEWLNLGRLVNNSMPTFIKKISGK